MIKLLLNSLISAPLLRPYGVPENIAPFCLVTDSFQISKLKEFIKQFSEDDIKYLALIDYQSNIIYDLPETLSPKVGPFSNVKDYLLNEFIYFMPQSSPSASIYLRKLADIGIQHVYFVVDHELQYCRRYTVPDFYEKNINSLANAFKLFSHNEDQKIFIGCVKCNITGNPAYIPITPYEEYFHPDCSPEEGDIIIDGGISDVIDVEASFLDTIGVQGQIFAFEPVPWMADKAADQLSGFKNLHVFAEGLSDRDGWDVIIDARYSSYMPRTRPGDENFSPDNVIPCKVTKIDTFVQRKNLARVDCIKLDLEGSEMMALMGAKETIRHFKPKLIICLYHKPTDIFEIPLFINSLVPEYKMRLTHTQCSFLDTVLHAYVPKD